MDSRVAVLEIQVKDLREDVDDHGRYIVDAKVRDREVTQSELSVLDRLTKLESGQALILEHVNDVKSGVKWAKRLWPALLVLFGYKPALDLLHTIVTASHH